MAEHRTDPGVPVRTSDRELLSQCRVDVFRAGGKGGQHQNVTESGVRLTHLPTGVVASSRRRRPSRVPSAGRARGTTYS